MVGDIDGTERLLGKAVDQRGAAFVGGFRHQQLVGFGAVFGVGFINQRIDVADGAQTVHMAFAEEIAAFADFLNQLFERDALPLSGAAWAHPLERLENAVWGFLMLEHGRSTRATGGAAFQAVVTAQHGVDLAHRCFHGGGVCGGQRVIGVAGNTDDPVVGSIDAHTYAALCPAAQTRGGADHLAGLGRQFAADGIDAEFGHQRVAARGALGGFARAASDQPLGSLGHGFTIACGKSRQTACNGTAAQQHAAATCVGAASNGAVGLGVL